MVNVAYSEAISEVLDILSHTRKEDVDKISPKFIEFLRNNASKDYRPNLDHTKQLEDMDLKPKTKAFIGLIYRQFFANEEQKIEYDKELKENERIYQEQLREIYNPNNVFKDKKTDIIQKEYSNIPVVKNDETFLRKIINMIKNIFKIK